MPRAGDSKFGKRDVGAFVSMFRRKVLPGIEHFDWIRLSTSAFCQLLLASCGIVVHKERHTYYINEADFSQGQFASKTYLGTQELGWDRFDHLFSAVLEPPGASRRSHGASSLPATGTCVQNINDGRVLCFDKKGRVTATILDPEWVEKLVLDRDFQSQGSILAVPIVAREAQEAKRALAYLYSTDVSYFEFPMDGYAALLLAGAVAPALRHHFSNL